MTNLLLAILCSTTNILLFRFFDKYNIPAFQAIAFNYLICVLMGFLTLETGFGPETFQENWLGFAFILGAIFVYSFYLIALVTQRNGVAIAAVSTKLALVIPVISAFFLYDEQVTSYKIIGIVLAIVAVFFTSSKQGEEGKINYKYLILPLFLWLIDGSTTTLFGWVEDARVKEGQNALFLIFVFGTAGINGLFLLAMNYFRNPQENKVEIRGMLGGFLLGIPNYGSCYFLMNALSDASLEKTTVFTVASIGVVVLSSFMAYLLFKERLSTMNLVGIGLAVCSIFLMSFF